MLNVKKIIIFSRLFSFSEVNFELKITVTDYTSHLPKISLRPNTDPAKMPIVMKSWWPVPKAPLYLTGVISARYIGANCVAKPAKNSAKL